METNLSIKALSLLLAGMMAFGFVSCKDDEFEQAPDFNEPEVNITIPTEDEVKTTVGKTYAVGRALPVLSVCLSTSRNTLKAL